MSRRTRPGVVVAVLGVIGLIGIATTMTHAQRGRPRGDTTYFTSQVQVAGSRAVTQKIDMVKRDLESGEFDRCVRTVQAIIDRHGAGAYSNESGRFVGVRDFCNQFLADLPKEGLDLYRTLFDPRAGELYRRGIDEQNPDVLRDVYLRYVMTSYGKKAMGNAVWMLLESGRLEDAVDLALLFRETWKNDDTFGPTVTAALTLGLRKLGRADDLVRLEHELSRTDDARLHVDGRETKLRAFVADTVRETPRLAPRESTPYTSQVFNEAQWTAEIILTSNKQSTPFTTLDDFRSRTSADRYHWNPIEPVMDEGAVYLNTGTTLRSISLFTGTDKWPPVRGPVETTQARRNLDVNFHCTLDNDMLFGALETPVKREQRIWNFTPQFAVPHRQLVAVDASTGRVAWSHYFFKGRTREETELIAELNINSAPLVIGDKLYVAGSRFHTNFEHYLCCFDRKTGAMRWWTFVLTGQMEQNMFGNPVRESMPGQIVESNGVLYYSTNVGAVAAVDARLGTLRFTTEYQQTPIPRKMRFDGSVLERAPGWRHCPPIDLGRHVLFAPTDSLDLIAVDKTSGRSTRVATRSAANRYRYVVGPYRDMFMVAGLELAFFDAKTLKLLGKTPIARNRGGALHGAAGRPTIAGNQLYLTARSHREDKLMIWDLNRKTLTQNIDFGVDARDHVSRLGNFTSADDVVVLAATDPRRGRTRVRCFFDERTVRNRLATALENTPHDPRLHIRSGALAMQTKAWAKALSAFERAHDLATRSQTTGSKWQTRARQALYRIYVELAEQPSGVLGEIDLDRLTCLERAFVYAADRAQQVDILFHILARHASDRDWTGVEATATRITNNFSDSPYDYIELFQTLVPELPLRRRYPQAGMVATLVSASVADRVSRREAAVERYQRLLANYPNAVLGARSAWQLAFERIDKLIKRHGRKLYAPQDEQARRLYNEARQSNDASLLRRMLDLYPNSELVRDAYGEMARLTLGTPENRTPERIARATQVAHEFMWRFGEATSEMVLRLAEGLAAGGANDSLQSLARYAEKALDGTQVRRGESRVALKNVISELAGNAGADTVAPKPKFAFEFSEAWRKVGEGRDASWALLDTTGHFTADRAGAFLVHGQGRLWCIDAAGGDVHWTFDLPHRPSTKPQVVDGRVVLLEESLFVLDARTGKTLWTRPAAPGEEFVALVASHGKLFTVVRPTTSELRFGIRAHNLLDGTLVNEVAFEGIPHSAISASDRWIMVPVSYKPKVMIIDALTGAEARGIVGGLEYLDAFEPQLSRNGRVVTVSADESGGRRLRGTDPLTGRHVWSRPIESGRIRSLLRTPDRLAIQITARQVNRGEIKPRLAIYDITNGTALYNRNLRDGTVIRGDRSVLFGDRFFAVTRFTQMNRSRRNAPRSSIQVEAFSLETDTSPWRTSGLPRAHSVQIEAWDDGLVIGVTESLATHNGRRPSRTSIYTVDGRSGRLLGDQELDERRTPRFNRTMMLVGDRLVVSDGPTLKVFKP